MPPAFDPLSVPQRERFARQLALREVGPEGQARLGAARVVVVGAGGLGCPVLSYLHAAGVGELHVVDGDRIERSNLNRQVLYREEDIGRPKARVAAERLEGGVTWSDAAVTGANVAEVLKGATVLLDATDNFEARFLLADACRLLGLPLVQAAVTGFSGQLATYLPDRSPCYRCFFPHPTEVTIPGCSEAGVLGAAAGVMGSLQALEAIKLIARGPDATHHGRLLVVDLWGLGVEAIALPANPDCELCGPRPAIATLADAGLEGGR